MLCLVMFSQQNIICMHHVQLIQLASCATDILLTHANNVATASLAIAKSKGQLYFLKEPSQNVPPTFQSTAAKLSILTLKTITCKLPGLVTNDNELSE